MSVITKTQVQLYDSTLTYVTRVLEFVPLDSSGTILRYSKELSDFGQCTFRISSYDPIFTQYGDIVQPHATHIRVVRGTDVVWSGAIIENSKRTKDYVEVVAAEYLWYLGRTLITRSSIDPATNTADDIYRIFNSGTMAAAVTALMNETVTRWKGVNSAHPLSNVTLGEIDNPDYPPNMTDGNSPPNALSGPWSFGDGTNAPQMTFDFHNVLYVLKSFGAVTYADFGIDENLVFTFRSFFGIDNHYDVNFTYGEHGNVVDFNIPRLGQQMANELWGIATDDNGNVLNTSSTDQTSITTNGLIETVAAYADIKDQATLIARVQAELPLISEPSDSPMTMTLSEKAYPLGIYDIGDIITVNVNHIFTTYTAVKRVVGLTVALNSTGRELTTVQMNTPLPSQIGGS